MAEVDKTDYTKEKHAWFRVTQPPGFATGIKVFEVGEAVEWAPPPEWDEKKLGKHFSCYFPSVTFEPLNKQAEEKMAEYRKVLAKKAEPKLSAEEMATARFNRLEEMFVQLMESNMKKK